MSARLSILTVIILLMSACIKDELPVEPVHGTDVESVQVCIGSTYYDQVYFNLTDRAVVASNNQLDWDIALRSDITNTFVRMNSSRFMRAALTSSTDLLQVTDTLAVANEFLVDVSSGEIDSLAIDITEVVNQVLILDMGYNHFGLHQGFKKLKVESFSPNGIVVRYADLYVSNMQNTELITIAPDLDSYMTYVSFMDDQLVSIEPVTDDYDLLFTRYTTHLDSGNLDYLVTGVLTEPEFVRVAELLNADFENVHLDDTLLSPFTSDRDAIGFDWKHFDFNDQVFISHPTTVYLIQDASGDYHKMRFTDFYNDLGQKGCPTFDIVSF